MDGLSFVEIFTKVGAFRANLEKLGDLCAFEGILEEFGGFFRWLDEFGCSDSAEFGKMSKGTSQRSVAVDFKDFTGDLST